MNDELLEQDWPEPAEEDVRALHEAVMLRVRRQRARRHGLRWLTAGAVAAFAAFCVLQTGRTPEIKQTQERPVVAAVEMPIVKLPPLQPISARFTPLPHRRPTPGLRSVALITPPNGPPLIKLITTDPNVVILLPSDEASSTERTQSNE